jgi:peptide/nickel transport system permease protein
MASAAILKGRRMRAGGAQGWRPGVVAGLLIIVALIVAGYVAPLPYDPTAPDVTAILQPPSADHWFGTDASGFDVFSRTIEAPRRDLPLAIGGMLLSLLIGVPLGLLAGGKTRLAEFLMRGLDVFQAFPLVIIAIAIVTLTGNHIQNVVYAIAVINVPRFMRLIRGEALALRESRFMEAAVATGCSPVRIMFRHLLPNVLGIGVSPPDPTWGSMIQSGAQNIAAGQWWVSVFPSIGLFIAVLSFNAIANGLQLEHRPRG